MNLRTSCAQFYLLSTSLRAVRSSHARESQITVQLRKTYVKTHAFRLFINIKHLNASENHPSFRQKPGLPPPVVDAGAAAADRQRGAAKGSRH